MTDAASTKPRTEDFTAILTLPAGPDTVAALFTSAAGVSRWWGPTEGDATVGGTLVTSFGEHGVNATRVLEVGPKRVVWEPVVVDGTTPTAHTREWLGTTIEFDIIPAPTGSELRFRHAGLTPQLACWDDCFAGWTHFMGSIETFAKTGTGLPFGSSEAGPMVERTRSAPAAPDAVLRALADPHRRQIMRLVQHTELPAGRIAASFTLTQQAVSLHIGVLKQAGLLTERREGSRRFYALRHESLEPVRDLLSEFWPDALSRLKRAVETAHPRPTTRQP